MTDRAAVSRWLAGYEAAWRAPGTESLAGIFTDDASYRQSPYMEPVVGLDAIRRMWEEEREAPDEVFSLATQIVAVDGPMAVVRAEVGIWGSGQPGVPRPVADPARRGRPLQLVRGVALLARATLRRLAVTSLPQPAVVLVTGIQAAGKSTVAQLLAERLAAEQLL